MKDARKEKARFKKNLRKGADAIRDCWKKDKEKYMSPLQDSVPGLAVNDLAQLAETLVRFTAMRTTLAGEYSVGGPIDVAVITKRDGFQWVRQKDTFDRVALAAGMGTWR